VFDATVFKNSHCTISDKYRAKPFIVMHDGMFEEIFARTDVCVWKCRISHIRCDRKTSHVLLFECGNSNPSNVLKSDLIFKNRVGTIVLH